jgi:hypothetical protein
MLPGEEFLDRVEREFEQHLRPVYHPDEAVFPFSKVVQAAKVVSPKLPFENLQDAGDLLLLWCCSTAAAPHDLDATRCGIALISACGMILLCCRRCL